MIAKLFLVPRPQRGGSESAIQLKIGELKIGRTTECDIYIPDPTVSREHAILHVTPRQMTLTDLKSRNGTWLDSKQISSAIVIPGQEIMFGSVRFVISSEPHEESGLDEEVLTCDARSIMSLNNKTLVPLTPRQEEVFQLLLQGLPEKEIATSLGIAKDTAHNHIRKVYQAYDVRSRIELLVKLAPPDLKNSKTSPLV